MAGVIPTIMLKIWNMGWFRKLRWYLRTGIGTFLIVAPVVGVSILSYYKYNEPGVEVLEDIVWDSGLGDWLGITKDTWYVASFCQSVLYGIAFCLACIVWSVSIRHKSRYNRLRWSDAEKKNMRLASNINAKNRILASVLELLDGIIVIVDDELEIICVSDGYGRFNIENNLDLPTNPYGHRFCNVFWFLKTVKNDLLRAFDGYGKICVMADIDIGEKKYGFDITFKPVGKRTIIDYMIVVIRSRDEIRKIGPGDNRKRNIFFPQDGRHLAGKK